jgi:hypothetical protein
VEGSAFSAKRGWTVLVAERLCEVALARIVLPFLDCTRGALARRQRANDEADEMQDPTVVSKHYDFLNESRYVHMQVGDNWTIHLGSFGKK